MRLKNDKRLRDKLFTVESYRHPAKGHLECYMTVRELVVHLQDEQAHIEAAND